MPVKKRPKAKPVSSKWAKLLALIPGYDSVATAAPGDWFDEAAADRAIQFFAECIKHVEGKVAGEPFILQPWQQAIVGCLVGWKRINSDGIEIRRYREVFLYVPRKNGKSPLVAAIGLYIFFCDNEAGQQNYIAASDKEQAGLLFRQAKGMVEAEPELFERCRIYGGNATAGQARSIVREADSSFMRVISADASGKHGGTSHLVIIDELHEQPNRDLVDVLSTSMASKNRIQPLFISLTTADFDRPSVCNEKYLVATRVRDGLTPDSEFLPVIYEALPEDDWKDERTWEKANPNIDVSVERDYLRRCVLTAEASPEFENTFKRLHLNLKTQSAVKWINLQRWDLCNRGAFPTAGRDVFLGIDLSSLLDLTAVAALYPCEMGGYDVDVKFFIPGDNVKAREDRDHVPYSLWCREGYIVATEGDVVDYEAVLAYIRQLAARSCVRKVLSDPWNAEAVCQKLIADGLDVEKINQGLSTLSGGTKEMEKLYLAGQLNHSGNPVMRWMAGHVVAERDGAENMKPSKRRSSEKIDGITAAVIGLAGAIREPVQQRSVYAKRGMIRL